MSHINLVGWLKLYRQIVISDIWIDGGPYDERSAFIYILSQALFTPGYIRGVWVKRGQFATSERELAEIFKWSPGRVHRLLKKLSEKGSINFEYITDHRTTLITITNFELFQGDGGSVTDQSQISCGSVADQQQITNGSRYKKEEIKNQEEESKSPAVAGPPPAVKREPPIGSKEWLALHYDD